MRSTRINGHPEYEITDIGEVWRMEPSQADTRFGPVPRKLAYVYLGPKAARYPGVKLGCMGKIRTVLSLVKEHFPEGHSFVNVARKTTEMEQSK